MRIVFFLFFGAIFLAPAVAKDSESLPHPVIKVTLNGDLSNEKLKKLIETIDEINVEHNGARNINLFINGSGGGVFNSIQAFNVIKSSAIPVNTINQGVIDSDMLITFCAGKNRYSSAYALFSMPSFNLPSTDDVSNIKGLRANSVVAEDLNNLAQAIYSSCTTLSKKELNQHFENDKEKMFTSFSQAKKIGLAENKAELDYDADVYYIISD